ncbi:hypothetical protein QYE76_025786 [Lolium multiflorum]|uniref:F-box domain-containing protein n=1 Tax=Lolium multiflorum TaxID=4521 RepID=A0AAD8VUY2_LOLMU|nr:hypothetical protein QYE76_025786 [Lolium multiflorum]
MNREEGKMTPASRRRRRGTHSLAASPLDDDDLLREILVRLSPQPSSLPRASAVCKRWRRLVSDPGFFRRFRLHHCRNPPLLGFFEGSKGLTFVPTLEAPNRVHPGRFSLPSGVGDCFKCLGCRHGLVLISLRNRLQALVWDPVTGDQHRFTIPPGVATYGDSTLINGAVLRAAGHFQFQVVVVAADGDNQRRRALACVYSSQTGLWGDLISTPLSYKASGCIFPTFVNTNDAVLAGDSLYWVLAGNSERILEFDLVNQILTVIRVPVDARRQVSCFTLIRAEGGGLGVFFLSGSDSNCTAQSWERKTDCCGVASWLLARTIELDKILSLKAQKKEVIYVRGYAEENNVVFLSTFVSLFMVHLESLKFNMVFDTKPLALSQCHPFESVYAAEICGHDGADLLRST